MAPLERTLDEDPRLAIAACWYWIRKLQACFHEGHYASALQMEARAERLLWTSPTYFQLADYHFYSALVHAKAWDSATEADRSGHRKALAEHHTWLTTRAANCSETFSNRTALTAAELARLEDRALAAEGLYEEAIRSARDNGFVHNEAIAYERASDFYRTRGFDQFADLYLRNARYGYLRWGADGKVRQLDQMYPHLRTEEAPPGPTSTIGVPVERLDLAAVVKLSQAVSVEIMPDKLIDTLMRVAIEQAGAGRGLLALAHGDEIRIAAEAATSGAEITVLVRDQPASADAVPESVLHYVMRARVSVILDDALTHSQFAEDPYVRRKQARSLLCLPIVNQAKLVGVLYLENNLAPRVFSPARASVLVLAYYLGPAWSCAF